MNCAVVCGAFLFVVVAGTAGRAADWPRFLGPNADGISPETGINKDWTANPPKTLWKVDLSDEGFGGPSAADGKVFIIDHKDPQDVVRAIELQTGKEVWAYAYEETQKKNWGYTRSTPTFNDGRLYTLSRMGKLHCLNAKDGKVIWQKDLVTEFGGKVPKWEMAGSPLIDGDQLIVCPGGENAAVVALDKKTGAVIWKGAGSDKPGYATPVLATINGQKQYVIYSAASVMGVNPADGKVIWSYPWKAGPEVSAATPIVFDNSVFITAAYNTGCALLKIEGDKVTPVWKNKTMQAEFSTPVLFQNFLYDTTTSTGELLCMDPKDGQTPWRQKGFEQGGVMAVDGVLLALTGKEGDLVMVELNPKEYKELGRIKPLGGRSWTAPILTDGKLIIRNEKALACLDLKPPAK